MIKSYNELPIAMKVTDVAAALGVSRRVAYDLTRQKGFPVVRVGPKRLVVPRDKFLKWIDEQAAE